MAGSTYDGPSARYVILRRLAEKEKDHKREKRENRPETAGTHEKRDR